MGSLTKPERRAVIKRVAAFRKEFARKPEHAVSLTQWYDEYHCGTFGCVGGYAEHSPLMRKLKKEHKNISQSVYVFFGLTNSQCCKIDLFGFNHSDHTLSDKVVALKRLDKVLAIHKKQLEK